MKGSQAYELTLSMVKSETPSSTQCTTWPEGHFHISLQALPLSDSTVSVNKHRKWWCQDIIMFIFLFIQLYYLILSLKKKRISHKCFCQIGVLSREEVAQDSVNQHTKGCVCRNHLRPIQERHHPVNLTEIQTSWVWHQKRFCNLLLSLVSMVTCLPFVPPPGNMSVFSGVNMHVVKIVYTHIYRWHKS